MSAFLLTPALEEPDERALDCGGTFALYTHPQTTLEYLDTFHSAPMCLQNVMVGVTIVGRQMPLQFIGEAVAAHAEGRLYIPPGRGNHR